MIGDSAGADREDAGEGVLGVPYLFGALVLVAAPAVATVLLAFTDADGLTNPAFVGTDNFAAILGDARFGRAVLATLTFAAISVAARMFAVATLALLLSRPGVTAALARVAVFLPSVLPETAVALVWLWLLDPIGGPVASVVGSFGIAPLVLLVDDVPARITVPLVAATRLGEGLVVAIAARRALPASLSDVAAVEGASAWQLTRRVTLPLLAPVLVLLAARDLMLAIGGGLGTAMVLTGGGPAGATRYLPQYVREEGFGVLRFGVAAAVGTLTIVVALGLVLVAARPLLRSWDRLR